MSASNASNQGFWEVEFMDHVLSSSFTGENFMTLDPEEQQRLFESLKAEVLDSRSLIDSIPAADLRAHVQSANAAQAAQNHEEDGAHGTETDPHGTETDKYALRETLRKEWGFFTGEEDFDSFGAHAVAFDNVDLYAPSSEAALVLCNHRHTGSADCACSAPEVDRLETRISTQLFYYRLATVFHMPPEDVDEHVDLDRSCWKVTLVYGDDDESTICFTEFRGRVVVDFSGGVEASVSALKLVNFLCGDCPHAGDGA